MFPKGLPRGTPEDLEKSFQVLIKKRKGNNMKKLKNIFNRISKADPMIWGYVMLNERSGK